MKNIQRDLSEQESKQHLVGWILFLFGAIFFIGSSIKNQDVLALVGSILFLISCVVFIIPLARKLKNQDDEKRK